MMSNDTVVARSFSHLYLVETQKKSDNSKRVDDYVRRLREQFGLILKSN